MTRYHDIPIAKSSIYFILKRHGLGRLPQNQRYKRYSDRWKRYEKPQPGCRLQIDVKFLKRLSDPSNAKRNYFQFTAIDDCTRLRVLKIYERNNQKNAMDFVDYVLSRLPFYVDVIQTDNGAEFDDHFHYHVQDLGIKHVYIKPRTPRLNGKVESCPEGTRTALTRRVPWAVSTRFWTELLLMVPPASTTNFKNGNAFIIFSDLIRL